MHGTQPFVEDALVPPGTAFAPTVAIRRYRSEPVEHAHDFHQFVLPLEGTLRMSVAGQRGAVSERRVAVVPSGRPHRFTGTRGNAFLVIDVPARAPVITSASGRAVIAHAERTPFVPIDVEDRPLIRWLARMTERGRLGGTMVDHGFALLLDALSSSVGAVPEGAWPESLKRMCAHAEARLEWPLTVNDLAAIGHLSASRVHAQFKRHLGTTPQAWITGRRLARAAELLAGTAMPVAAVAERVGYADPAAFGRAYRRHFGTTPLATRRAPVTRESGQDPR